MGDWFHRIQGIRNRIPKDIEEEYPQWLPPRSYHADGTLMSPDYGELDMLHESTALAKCRVILVRLSPSILAKVPRAIAVKLGICQAAAEEEARAKISSPRGKASASSASHKRKPRSPSPPGTESTSSSRINVIDLVDDDTSPNVSFARQFFR